MLKAFFLLGVSLAAFNATASPVTVLQGLGINTDAQTAAEMINNQDLVNELKEVQADPVLKDVDPKDFLAEAKANPGVDGKTLAKKIKVKKNIQAVGGALDAADQAAGEALVNLLGVGHAFTAEQLTATKELQAAFAIAAPTQAQINAKAYANRNAAVGHLVIDNNTLTDLVNVMAHIPAPDEYHVAAMTHARGNGLNLPTDYDIKGLAKLLDAHGAAHIAMPTQKQIEAAAYILAKTDTPGATGITAALLSENNVKACALLMDNGRGGHVNLAPPTADEIIVFEKFQFGVAREPSIDEFAAVIRGAWDPLDAAEQDAVRNLLVTKIKAGGIPHAIVKYDKVDGGFHVLKILFANGGDSRGANNIKANGEFTVRVSKWPGNANRHLAGLDPAQANKIWAVNGMNPHAADNSYELVGSSQ